MNKRLKNKIAKISLLLLLLFLLFTIFYVLGILNCSKENKKNIPEEIISKISYIIPTSAYFIKNLQNFIENVISIQGEDCIKRENNKKIFDKCKFSDSLIIEGQLLEEQNLKYILNITVSSNVSSNTSPEIKGEVSGEFSLSGSRFIFENISLHIVIMKNGLPQESFFSFSNILSIKFPGGYTLRNEQEKIGKINIEFGDKVQLDLINLDYTQYQSGNTIDATITGKIISYGGCVGNNTYDVNITTKSEIRESGSGPSIIIPVCPLEITGTINSSDIKIKKDLCLIPQNVCKFPE